MRHHARLAVAASFLLWSLTGVSVPSFAASEGDLVTGPVVEVLNAGAFQIMQSDSNNVRHWVEVQLAGVQALSGAQRHTQGGNMEYLPGFRQSDSALTALIHGKVVSVRVIALDSAFSGRISGQVMLDSVDVAEFMVSQGWVWTTSTDPAYARLRALEAESKQAGRGLWGIPEYRDRSPAEVSDDLLDVGGGDFAEPFKRWRLALLVAVVALSSLALGHVWKLSRELQSDAELPREVRHGSIAGRLLLLSVVVPGLYVATSFVAEYSRSTAPEGGISGGGIALYLILMTAAFLPPILAAAMMLAFWSLAVLKRSDRYRGVVSAMGYAGALGTSAGAYLFAMDQLYWSGAGDYLLFAPFFLWPGIFAYALTCALAGALIAYLVWRLLLLLGHRRT